jgi:uncharacterized protein YaiE (UPF0345 family)
VKLPGSQQLQTFRANEQFTVEADQRFKVQVESNTAYLCTYG